MALEKIGVQAVIEGLSSFNKGMKDMKRGIIGVGDAGMTAAKRTETLNNALKVTGIAFTAAATASGAMLYSSVKLAARVETLGVVTKVLGKNVGKTEDEIRALEKAVQDQGITLLGSRQAIAKMIQSNIDLAYATDFASEAQDAAVIAGINSSEAFERLVNVVSTGSVVMARTLGLQVNFQRAYETTAESLGKNVDQLTEQEKAQARANEVKRAGVNIEGAYAAAMETAGKLVTSLPRHLEESKRMLGEAWLPTYAKVIDFVTNSLKKWEALSQTKKDVISSTLGMVTAFVGIVGVLSLVGSKVTAAVGAFQTLATAVAGSGTVVFSANMVLGIYLAALLAVGAAIYMIIKTINIYKAGLKAVNDAYVEHEKHMREVAGSYEEYRKEMIRSGLLVAKAELGQRKYNRILKEGGEESVLAAVGINVMSAEVFTASRNAEQLEERTRAWKGSIRGAGLEIATATGYMEQFNRTQEEMQSDLDLLNKTIDLDITEQFKDYAERVGELNNKIAELEAMKDITADQREDLEKTRKELIEVQKQWDMTTARIIFDLAEQRLAIDGLTEEELRALRQLAGPEGLGLIDQAAVELLDTIDVLAGGLDEAGDQSAEFATRATELQTPLQNAANKAGGLASALNQIKSKHVTITTEYKSIYSSREEGRLRALGIISQHGRQFLQAGSASLVGESGLEAFIPRQSGMILNNRFLNAMNTLVAALKSAPMLAAAPAMASPSTNNNQQYNYNLNLTTRAQSEPIISDFRALQAMGSF